MRSLEEKWPEHRRSTVVSVLPATTVRQSVSLHSMGNVSGGSPPESPSISAQNSEQLESRVRSSMGTHISEDSRKAGSSPKRSTVLLSEGNLPSSLFGVPDEAPAKSFVRNRKAHLTTHFTTMSLNGLRRSGTVVQAARSTWVKNCTSWSRAVVRHRYFQALILSSLLAALLLPDVWVLADRPDNTDLDVLLTIVFVLFIAEVVMQTAASSRFLGSFFFWMDLVGAILLLLDISYLPFFVAGEGVFKSVVLTARFARLGARACRLGRLLKLLRFLPGVQGPREASEEGMVSVMSLRLNQALSTSVSMLIIASVTVIPLFSIWTYPEEDWSVDAWMEILETIGTRSPEQLDEQLLQFEQFYADMAYFPYRLTASFANSVERTWQPSSTSLRAAPVRRWNVRRLSTGHIRCDFNVKAPNQREALINMSLLVLVAFVMATFSFVLSRTVSHMIVQPLKRLLHRLVCTSQKIFASVSMMADTVQAPGEQGKDANPRRELTRDGTLSCSRVERMDSLQSEDQAVNEMQLLEDIMDRLSVVAGFIMGARDGKDQVGELDAEGRSILVGFSSVKEERDDLRKYVRSTILDSHLCIIQSVGLSVELVDSWDFNPLGLDRPRCQAACMYFLSPCHHSVPADPSHLQSFLGAAESGYNNVQFHSWFHAVDVTHCMYRFLSLFKASLYLGSLDRYALLVSAIAHDLGHSGLKNQFLVETSHELAMRYNDASPLENMHCHRLFEILSVPRSNILSALSHRQFKEVRHVCLEAILHTDIGLHFPMIKELQILYEMNSPLQECFQLCSLAPHEWPSEEAVLCYQTQETRQLLCRLLLHLSDTSNPFKPFRICRVWAHRCLDEFFAQGDAELAAGLPVGSLHDRSKVNREYSQIGFIEFLMAPMAFAAMRLITPFLPCVEQLLDNVRQWQELWLEASKPPVQEREAVEARLKKLDRRFVECG